MNIITFIPKLQTGNCKLGTGNWELGTGNWELSKLPHNTFNMLKTFFLLLPLMIFACRQNDSPSPLQFKGYENNPVLVPGEPGSWDDLLLLSSFTLKYHDSIYLFYSAYSKTGSRAIGLATSSDGYHFTKFLGNPILEGDKTGFDAFGVAQAQVLKEDSVWVLFYNAREIAGFSSGPSFGRATATSLTGPWTRSNEPVLTSGSKGEWDADFIYLGPVLRLDDGSYIMYFSGGDDLASQHDFFIGMATSRDGIKWKKHNDTKTTQHPFAESDPVIKTGDPGDWDADCILSDFVKKTAAGFEMYFAGARSIGSSAEDSQKGSIGYATSNDGIHWNKHPENPVYRLEDDPYFPDLGKKATILQNAKLLFQDSTCFMYYDYGNLVGKIGVATAKVPAVGR